MKISKMFMPTLREVPAEAEISSHQLMLRAGLMRKIAAGIYSFLPLGYRSLRKVEQIVREEMDKAGALELIMPAILPAEVYQQSGRWSVFGPEMFKFTDRNDRDFCLGPTHEEPFTLTVKSAYNSYKQLPVTLYQIQNKYRDEKRPRYGVIRSREFIMKDAYSFDVDEAGLDKSYQAMYKAYCAIFTRLGMDFTVIDADSGAMGGSGSQEFMVKSEIGEDTIVYCEECGYGANIEKATCVKPEKTTANMLEIEKVETPEAKTIEDLTAFFNVGAEKFAKTLLYVTDDGRKVAAMVRGDRELNETKLANALGANSVELMSFDDVRAVTGAQVGFAGPVGLDIPVYADYEVAGMYNFIVGANETNYHYNNVNFERDFKAAEVLDLRNIELGDICPQCGKPIKLARGIEVGHIFKLGTKYSDSLDCTYLDENGKSHSMIMGCYGIGVNRCLAAVIEQHCDGDGIIWPMSVAPYHVDVVCVNKDDETQMAVAEKIHDELEKLGVEVVLDDRKERPGVKFKDADLIGFPIRITVGKKAGEGVVEYKLRRGGDVVEMSVEEAIENAKTLVFDEK